MLVWFLVLAVTGVSQLTQTPGVLAALDPRHAISYFRLHGFMAFRSLGAVFLVVTGGEALYADMGHVGVRAIRRGWFAIVMPALLLAYFGQGALLLRDPAAIDNPFYRMVPDWATAPLVVLATAATIIASQALISGAFSLTMQAVKIDHLPHLTIRHTSSSHAGQIYVPAVNWLLMVACIGLVVGFGSSARLAGAYGVAVTATMAITTILFGIVAVQRLGWPPLLTTVGLAPLLAIDLTFFSANLLKIPDGGWFPLAVAAVVVAIMGTWRSGHRQVMARRRAGATAARDVLSQAIKSEVARVPGAAFYLHPRHGQTPPALVTNLRANHVLHEQVVLVTVVTESVPRVPPARRVAIDDLDDGLLVADLHFGFADVPDVPRALEEHDDPIFDLDDAVFMLSSEQLRTTARVGSWRGVRDRLFMFLDRNAANTPTWYRLPPGRVIEIGSVLEL